jgi:POT family proton-dependent oligopeptide transporter
VGAQKGNARLVLVIALNLIIGVPMYYGLLSIDAQILNWILIACFVVPAIMLVIEAVREGKVQRDKVFAMLIILAFNVFFWCFFEQAGSSFTFLADKVVNRDLGFIVFPNAWFQSVNSVAIIVLAPIIAWIWVRMGKSNPSIPRKFSLGLIFNGLAFLLLMFALAKLVEPVTGKIPFWTLFAVYWIQSIGELCLSPIGLSMTTKLAPARLTGFAMGAWFLSVAIGNNLAGLFAGEASGDSGMTTQSAYAAYSQGFWILMVAGVALFLIAPLVNKLMHGVK